jgi:hypothetical protein
MAPVIFFFFRTSPFVNDSHPGISPGSKVSSILCQLTLTFDHIVHKISWISSDVKE